MMHDATLGTEITQHSIVSSMAAKNLLPCKMQALENCTIQDFSDFNDCQDVLNDMVK